MQTTKTHFEQISVEMVKKIAQEVFPELQEIQNDNVILKVPVKNDKRQTRSEHSRCRNGI